MKRALCAALWLCAGPLSGAYQYYLTDPLTSIDLNRWSQTGAVVGSSLGLTPSTPTGPGGYLVSRVAVPDGTADYEVAATIRLTGAIWDGAYRLLMRGASDASSYYAAEVAPVTTSRGVGLAQLIKRDAAGNQWLLASTYVPARDGMTVRTVRRAEDIRVYVDGTMYMYNTDSGFTTGQAGVGILNASAGNALSSVRIGVVDRVAPQAVSLPSVSLWATANKVHLQWAGAADDANGAGVSHYNVARGSTFLGALPNARFTDETVQPGTSYLYYVVACDYHGNCGPFTEVPVTTPPAGSTDPVRIGIRPTGAYWGAGSEQIDVRSGNLNFSMPLVKAMGRGSWGVGFGLSYNSQVWRQEGGTTWKLGGDVGYGFGWRLTPGSLSAVYSDLWTVHHYVFTDAGGAEYRLDINNSGIWTSRDSIYLSYDAARNRLYFPDGSYWVFGAYSSGVEDDAGTRYPTLMQDTNGNQVAIYYLRGAGSLWENSSARIDYIDDVRSGPPQWNERQIYATYLFAYNADAVPHLTSIQSRIGSGETYTFVYAVNQPLYSPWGQAFGTTTLLGSVSNAVPRTNSFEYSLGTGELTRAVLPYGGDLRWTYRNFTYAGNRTLREVQYRYLTKSAGETPVLYPFTHDDVAGSLHAWTTLNDPDGTQKAWWFGANGEQTAFEDRAAGGSP
ncbi:MAG TPA: hypothetical protein VGM23_08225, partial [Armatimonadota bacterium]